MGRITSNILAFRWTGRSKFTSYWNDELMPVPKWKHWTWPRFLLAHFHIFGLVSLRNLSAAAHALHRELFIALDPAVFG